MSDRTERFVAEYTPRGEERPRTFVVDYSTDDQFVLNAAAWLDEMWHHRDGTITVRHQRLRNGLGWVQDESSTYSGGSLSRTAESPYAVDSPDRDSSVAGRRATSRKAALAVYPHTGTQRHRILLALAARPMTRDDIEVALDLGASSVHPRVLELMFGEWIVETTGTRKTRRGQDAVVLTVTPKGLVAIGRNETTGVEL